MNQPEPPFRAKELVESQADTYAEVAAIATEMLGGTKVAPALVRIVFAAWCVRESRLHGARVNAEIDLANARRFGRIQGRMTRRQRIAANGTDIF